MINRVADGDVRALIPNTIIASLDPFITTANVQVDALAASEHSGGLSDGVLIEVEKWLAAHYAAVVDPSVCLQSEKVEGAQVVASRGVSGVGILSTQFGQMADALSGGGLAQISMRKASIGFF